MTIYLSKCWREIWAKFRRKIIIFTTFGRRQFCGVGTARFTARFPRENSNSNLTRVTLKFARKKFRIWNFGWVVIGWWRWGVGVLQKIENISRRNEPPPVREGWFFLYCGDSREWPSPFSFRILWALFSSWPLTVKILRRAGMPILGIGFERFPTFFFFYFQPRPKMFRPKWGAYLRQGRKQ